MKILIVPADVRCDHDGKVLNNPSQHWVEITGHPVLVELTADDLAQSRSEVQDPYVALMLLGAVIALALSIAGVALRRREGLST